MDALAMARDARDQIKEWEASLVRLTCPKCRQWCEVPPGTQALCQPCDRVMKVLDSCNTST